MAAAAASEPSEKKGGRMTLRKWSARAFWSFGEHDSVCAVCRNMLDELCKGMPPLFPPTRVFYTYV